MKREIKFRAWDKSEKKWVKRVQEDRIPTTNTREGFRLNSYFILNQYTGFKDKTGKPIYEGDILQWSYGRDSDTFTGKVVFGHHSVGENSWSIDLYTVGFFIEFYDKGISGIEEKLKMYKIIGNIYENPELVTPS